ncbi:serine O-acetyltransferase [Pseudidiomarina terrestris]|uniref:serine O-acetyltransferase n=1 Tax=Pseudidiomarina terrestris TaxID=2820060 RepID=UPI003AAF9E43
MNSFSIMKSYIKQDLVMQQQQSLWKAFIFNPISRFTILLRLNELLYNKDYGLLMRGIPYLWFRRLSIRLGFSIPVNVFREGLVIVHYGLIVVSGDARIGVNCRIHAGVNIGARAGFKKPDDDSSHAPTIGNNCYIGPGAKLFGCIKIGNNCVIGANAVVNRSFDEDDLTIGGVPARIIANSGSSGMIYYAKKEY